MVHRLTRRASLDASRSSWFGYNKRCTENAEYLKRRSHTLSRLNLEAKTQNSRQNTQMRAVKFALPAVRLPSYYEVRRIILVEIRRIIVTNVARIVDKMRTHQALRGSLRKLPFRPSEPTMRLVVLSEKPPEPSGHIIFS